MPGRLCDTPRSRSTSGVLCPGSSADSGPADANRRQSPAPARHTTAPARNERTYPNTSMPEESILIGRCLCEVVKCRGRGSAGGSECKQELGKRKSRPPVRFRCPGCCHQSVTLGRIVLSCRICVRPLHACASPCEHGRFVVLGVTQRLPDDRRPLLIWGDGPRISVTPWRRVC
jgi:hypothetical protein